MTIPQVAENTRDLFLEVTSSENLARAKAVMDALVMGLAESEGVRGEEGEGVCVEQVRVVDDLVFTTIKVERPD